MDDALDHARETRSLLERLGARVPGFTGYLERELRREVDQLLRAELAGRLDALAPSVSAYARTLHLGAAGRLDHLASLDKRLDGTANAIRHAGSGYAGLFDAAKVREEELEALYRFDLALVEGVDAVREAAGVLGPWGGDGEQARGGRGQGARGGRRPRAGRARRVCRPASQEAADEPVPRGASSTTTRPARRSPTASRPRAARRSSSGAQLVVHEAQEAVFYRDGRALDVFGPGRHTLTTQNIPRAHQGAGAAVRLHVAVSGAGRVRLQADVPRPEVGHARAGGVPRPRAGRGAPARVRHVRLPHPRLAHLRQHGRRLARAVRHDAARRTSTAT